MVDRILNLIREKNMTPSQFADEIGIQRSGMSHLISGRNKPSLEFVMKVLQRFPEVSPGYLLYGNTDTPGEAATPAVEKIEKPAPELVSPTLFDQPATIPAKEKPRPVKTDTRLERPEKKMEKIVILYDDRTFKEYEPE